MKTRVFIGTRRADRCTACTVSGGASQSGSRRTSRPLATDSPAMNSGSSTELRQQHRAHAGLGQLQQQLAVVGGNRPVRAHPDPFAAALQGERCRRAQLAAAKPVRGRDVGGRGGRSQPLQQGRRGHDPAWCGHQRPGDHGRVGQVGDAQGQIEAATQRIHDLVAQRQLQLHVRMQGMEARQQWADHPQPERGGGVDAQHAARQGPAFPGEFLAALHLAQHLLHRFVVALAGFGQVQLAGGAHQQLHPQVRLQRVDLLAHGGACQVERAGRGREAVQPHDLDEGAHAVKQVHPCSPWAVRPR